MFKINFYVMEELVKKVIEKVVKVEEKMKESEGKFFSSKRVIFFFCSSEVSEFIKMEAFSDGGFKS